MIVLMEILLAAALAAAAGLLTHIYVQRWTTPKLANLQGGKAEAARYSLSINIAAYLTAVASAVVLCGLYYFLAGPWLSGSMFINGLCVSLLVLEIKGNVLRMPFMNWFVMRQMKHPAPLKAMILQMLDQWLSGFALGFIIVATCPVR